MSGCKVGCFRYDHDEDFQNNKHDKNTQNKNYFSNIYMKIY